MKKVFAKTTFALALVSGTLGLTTTPASAALGGDSIDAGRLSIGGRASYYDPKDGDGKWLGGAQVRLHLGDVFAIEGAADYRSPDTGIPNVNVHVYPVQASLLAYLFPGSPVTPYLVGGADWFYTTIEKPGKDITDHRFGAHAGAGLQAFLNKHWSIDGSYRYIWISKVDAGDINSTHDFDESGHQITAALNFHF